MQKKMFILFFLFILLLISSCAKIEETIEKEPELFCGDKKCTGGENSQNCPKDCGCAIGYYLTDNSCSPKCGDGIKTAEETPENCCQDARCSTGYVCEENQCIELQPELSSNFVPSDLKSITYYKAKERSIGAITLSNIGNSIAKDVTLTLSSPNGYFNNEILNFGSVSGGSRQSKSIKIGFTDKALEISTETELKLNIAMNFKDEHNRAHSDSETATFKVMGKNYISWLKPEEIASWITPNHPLVKEFASKSTAGLAADSSFGTKKNQELAARWLLESMRAYGIRYVNDPLSRAGDFVQFPTELLTNKAGDCEDNAVLYASLLAAIGMEPVIILTPSHAFAGYIDKEGELTPIETTSLDFDTALYSGRRNIEENQNAVQIIELDWWNNPQVILPVKQELKLPSITKQIGECGVSFNLQDLFVASVPITFTNSGEVPGAGCAAVSIYESGILRDEKVDCWVIQPGEIKTINYQPDISIFSGYSCIAT